ncbi:hypothetical protein [Nonomuraea sp. NPDC050540]|uniref:hypothetical protein n=1 Tax=Nonomuraea sp. NPDC050540 TaxID=3364367 RepID=UPI0037A408BE
MTAAEFSRAQDRFRIPRARRFDWLDPVGPPLRRFPGRDRRLPLVWPDPVIPEWPDFWPINPRGFPPLQPPSGTERHELTIPVSPTDTPGDDTRYESADGSAILLLPRYDLAFDQEEPRILIVDRAGTPTLVVVVVQVPTGLGELPHELSLSLRYRVPELTGGSVVVEVDFPATRLDGTGTVVSAELPLTGPGLRQQLLAAMSSLEARATVVVKRGITVAVPNPMLLIEPPPPQTYREVALLLECVAGPSPLLLSDAQRVRLGGGTTPTGVQGMRRLRVQHEGRGHSFWQDPARPEHFYFLPDRFLLGRLPGAGRRPALNIRATSAAREEDVRVTVEFMARPVVSTERLAAAEPVLAEEAGRMGSTAPVRMEILPDAQPMLRLALPQDGAAPSGLTERPKAQVGLEQGVTHAETFTLDDFRLVHAAFFGASLNVMNGEVRVGAGGGQPEDVELELRLDDTAGDVLELVPLTAVPKRVTARLVNAIESPVRVDRLKAVAVAAGRRVPLTVEGGPAGKLLAPGEELEIALVPAEPLPDTGAYTIVLDQSGVAVQVDREAVWKAVFDDSAKPRLSREVSVVAVPAMFGDPSGDRVALFVVSIVGAQGSVQLSETELKATTLVHVPVSSLLTGAPIPPLRYRTETIWQSGLVGVSPVRETDATILPPIKTRPNA